MKTVGRRKYDALKSFKLDDITEKRLEDFHKQFKGLRLADAIKMIRDFEKKYNPSEKSAEQIKNAKTNKPQKKAVMIDKDWLWERFTKAYFKNEGVVFSTKFNGTHDQNVIENIKVLFYYFIGDFENFKKCKHLSNLSVPSMDKGLLIIGANGNGKTSTMNALEDVLSITNVRFKGYSAKKIVKMYERCEDQVQKEEFNKLMTTGTRFFDDVLIERIASNYGKANILSDILFIRNANKKRTYITCNYIDESLNLETVLKQFSIKYGREIYDRIFFDFNIIEFKGKSRRR